MHTHRELNWGWDRKALYMLLNKDIYVTNVDSLGNEDGTSCDVQVSIFLF
jgi:hypothetical protein